MHFDENCELNAQKNIRSRLSGLLIHVFRRYRCNFDFCFFNIYYKNNPVWRGSFNSVLWRKNNLPVLEASNKTLEAFLFYLQNLNILHLIAFLCHGSLTVHLDLQNLPNFLHSETKFCFFCL